MAFNSNAKRTCIWYLAAGRKIPNPLFQQNDIRKLGLETTEKKKNNKPKTNGEAISYFAEGAKTEGPNNRA